MDNGAERKSDNSQKPEGATFRRGSPKHWEAAMVAAWLSFRVPPKVPMAVRQAEAMTTSFILNSLFGLRVTWFVLRVTCCAFRVTGCVLPCFALQASQGRRVAGSEVPNFSSFFPHPPFPIQGYLCPIFIWICQEIASCHDDGKSGN